jgi:hypothetical protein
MKAMFSEAALTAKLVSLPALELARPKCGSVITTTERGGQQ